ncbi:MAG: hypothetical protein Q9226_002212, partial [Calogaya cf. arnoldii]
MARQEQYRMPGGSSTTSSQTRFTPSETMPSPLATMVDVSQQAPEEFGTSNSPMSELAMPDGVWLMDLDAFPMPDMPVSFEQPSIDEGLDQSPGNQNEWVVYDRGQTNSQFA